MTLPFSKIYSGKSCFVTGHTGFKGSWLALWLKSLGAKVSGFSLEPPTDPSNFVASKVREQIFRHFQGDIRDSKVLREALQNSLPDFIFHLAAQSTVREGYKNPRETFDCNVIGISTLLDEIRLLNKPCVVIIVTSDKCYDTSGQFFAFRETDPMGGNDPYSASKGAAEILVSSYRKSFFPVEKIADHGIKLSSARAGNAIGGGDWAKDRIVPDIVKHIVQCKPVPVRNPHAARPWQHVLDCLSGYLTLGKHMYGSASPSDFCGSWNFGPNLQNESSVETLVKLFILEWGKGSWEDVQNPADLKEVKSFRLDIGKACQKLNWKPRWDFKTTISQTVKWYRNFYENPQSDMGKICFQEISEYENSTTGSETHQKNI